MGEESRCYDNLTTPGWKRINGISGSRPPKDSETPISAFVSQKQILRCYKKQTPLLFFTSFQPLTKIKACLHKYSIHMSFPNRIETKTHTSFSKSGSQLISFKALSLYETSNCPVWILYIILLFDLQFTNKLTEGHKKDFSPLISHGFEEPEEGREDERTALVTTVLVFDWDRCLARTVWEPLTPSTLCFPSAFWWGWEGTVSYLKGESQSNQHTNTNHGLRLCAGYAGTKQSKRNQRKFW